MNQRLIPFEPGMEGDFIPYEVLEDLSPEDESVALARFMHDNGLDALETPPASRIKTVVYYPAKRRIVPLKLFSPSSRK